MIALTKKKDYLGEGRARLLEQFKDKPRVDALLKAWLGEAQRIEDAAWDLYVDRLLQIIIGQGSGGFLAVILGFVFGSELTADVGFSIDPAGYESDLLDKIGKIVGQPRDGFNNQEYALLISARIQANRSDGRREDMIGILALLNPGTVIYARNHQPATFVLQTAPLALNAYYVMQRFLSKAISAGVKLYLLWSAEDPSLTLTWTTVYGSPVNNEDQAPGTAYSTPTGGGVWAGVAASEAGT